MDDDPLDDKVRVNIHLSVLSYTYLLELAGGERKLSRYLDATIKMWYEHGMSEVAYVHLAEAKMLLDKFFVHKTTDDEHPPKLQ